MLDIRERVAYFNATLKRCFTMNFMYGFRGASTKVRGGQLYFLVSHVDQFRCNPLELYHVYNSCIEHALMIYGAIPARCCVGNRDRALLKLENVHFAPSKKSYFIPGMYK